jgi:Uma2 family endonuclease
MEKIRNKIEEPSIGYKKHYTYADYLHFDFEYMVELIRGTIFKMSPAPSPLHQTILQNLHLICGPFFKKKQCTLWIAPFDVILPIKNKKNPEKNDTVVQPDLCIICDQKKINEKNCFGAPDLVLEVISPHTKKKDLQLKYEVYEESGVKEYWMVLPESKTLEVFFLDGGRYRRMNMYTEEDVFSPILFPEIKIDLAEVFQRAF